MILAIWLTNFIFKASSSLNINTLLFFNIKGWLILLQVSFVRTLVYHIADVSAEEKQEFFNLLIKFNKVVQTQMKSKNHLERDKLVAKKRIFKRDEASINFKFNILQ